MDFRAGDPPMSLPEERREEVPFRRRLQVGALWTIGVGVPLLAAPALHWQFGKPMIGVGFEATDEGRVAVTSVLPEGSAAAAGVQPGDTLVSVGDFEAPRTEADLDSPTFYYGIANEYRQGDVAEWVVLGDGERRTLSGAFVGVPDARLISLVVVIGVFWLVGLFLLWARPDRAQARFLVLTIFAYTPHTLFWVNKQMAVDTALGITLHQVASLSMFLGPALVVHFGVVFPVCTLSERARRWILIAAYGLGFAALYVIEQIQFVRALLSETRYVIDAAVRAEIFFHLRLWIIVGCFLVSGFLMYLTYRRVRDEEVRDPVKWVLWSVLLAAGIDALVLGVTVYLGEGIGNAVGTFRNYLYLLIPAGLLLAVFRHDLFDVDRLIRRSIVYFGTMGLLFVVFAVTEALVSEALEGMLPANSRTAGAAAAAVLIGALFQPLRRRMEGWTRRVLPVLPE